jgi:hypothetical protein
LLYGARARAALHCVCIARLQAKWWRARVCAFLLRTTLSSQRRTSSAPTEHPTVVVCFAHNGDGRKRRLSLTPRTEKGRQNSVPLHFLCWGWVSPYMQDGRCVHALASCTVSPFVLQRGATQLMGGEMNTQGWGRASHFQLRGGEILDFSNAKCWVFCSRGE